MGYDIVVKYQCLNGDWLLYIISALINNTNLCFDMANISRLDFFVQHEKCMFLIRNNCPIIITHKNVLLLKRER